MKPLLLIILGGLVAMARPVAGPAPVSTAAAVVTRPQDATVETKRDAILATARRYLGTYEATGHNDGPDIERWLRLTGAGKGDPWCAAYVYGVGHDAGYPVFPRSAWSPDMVRGGWKLKSEPSRRAVPGSAFGIYFASKGRVAHTGLVERDGGASITTIEGNTNQAGSREGDGVYRKYRPRSQVYSARDWL